MGNRKLSEAKTNEFDEFYTFYSDIQREVNGYVEYNKDVFRDKTILLPCDDPEWSNFTKFFAQNFDYFGLKKLISTSYALESKTYKDNYQLSLFETESNMYDKTKTNTHGKIFTLTRKKKKVNINDLEWSYLSGDGDFRSEEIKKLRDEADIIVTNPPFSLYREFIDWVLEKDKKFLIIGNKNSVTYKEVFPLIQSGRMWSGRTEWSGGLWFETRNQNDIDKVENGIPMKNVSSAWFTNIEHGKRHEPVQMMTMEKNIKFSKHKNVRGNQYRHYDNYDALEVPFYDAIPSDYDGVMGVPISFLERFNPDQFEIIGITKTPLGNDLRTKLYDRQIQHNVNGTTQNVTKLNDGAAIIVDDYLEKKPTYEVNGVLYEAMYPRLLIKRK